ncbi:hypothetical protein O3P69_012750 [Scylla paramamosain]|uniref:SNF2 N-terminal domain-containing protein n=1 Tax=Scylla paramamosain TaxID=85552 RepID=A0AAW0SCR0_SCYPA
MIYPPVETELKEISSDEEETKEASRKTIKIEDEEEEEEYEEEEEEEKEDKKESDSDVVILSHSEEEEEEEDELVEYGLHHNIVESLEQFKTSNGFGCILAHSMGLGKTLQIVSFTDVFLRHTSARSVLIIVPINTLQNWLAEYNSWLPEEGMAPPTTADGTPIWCRKFKVFLLNDAQKNLTQRSRVIQEWEKNGGVLLMGYELYRQLSLKKPKKPKKKKRDSDNREVVDIEEEDKNKELLEGTRTEFSNMFERPIQNGQCVDSTPQDMKLMRYRSHVLHSLLEGFVQRRGHSVLANTLPDKEEHVLLCRLTNIQRTLYSSFMSELAASKAMANPLKAFAICCKIWNHPDVPL